ncbi:nickel pincer cofactor biosynthesis protein LarC [Roseburia hominis]
MGKTLYLECSAGISGDMMAAALLDLGADQKVLDQALASIPAGGFSVEVGRVKKAGIDCCDFNVKLDAEHENHDHDMEYLHGKTYGHEAAHEHGDHGHHHELAEEHSHEHTNHGHHHHHEHRGMREVMEIIDACTMSESAKKLAVKIFQILARAEAKAHAVPVEDVHFHEVGAIDSIVDIVAVAVCVDNLGITDVIIPKLVEGCGTVRCQHGILPIPVPATANIVAEQGLKLQITEVKGEFVTPTGAAIAAALKTSDRLPEEFTIQKIGIGAGKRTYERPSILRAMLIESQEKKEDKAPETIWKLESNIDDCTGEALGYVMEQLFAAGARDVHYMPVYMKKNRPGWQLNVICSKEKIEALEQIIFRETTTIGIRRQEMARTVMRREIREVETSCGRAQVKFCSCGDIVRYYPEYESVASIAKAQRKPYAEVYREVMEAAADL